MAEISLRHVDALNRAVERLYEFGTLADLPERLFEVIAMVAPGHLMHLSVTKPGVGAVDAFLTLPAHQELTTLVENRTELARMPGVRDNSFYLTAETGPVSFHDLMSRETLESTILWQAFCRPLGLEHDISINFHRSSEFFYTISSSRDTQPYSREERLLLNWLQPHLRQRFRQFLAAEPDHPLGRPATNGIEVPSLICETDGRVLSISSPAQKLLGKCGLRLGGRLPMVWRDWLNEQVRPTITRPLQTLELRRPGGALKVHCLRNRHSGQHRLILEWVPRSGVALTSREKEVAGWVAQGKTNREISAILGISPATVKVHVERILEKLEVGNRTAAARLLATGGPE